MIAPMVVVALPDESVVCVVGPCVYDRACPTEGCCIVQRNREAQGVTVAIGKPLLGGSRG